MSPTSYQAAPPRVRHTAITLSAAHNWLRGPDLNRRPSGYEPDELPGCSTPRPSYCYHIVYCASDWLRGPDLNRRPSGYEPDELPGCSTPRPTRANNTRHLAGCKIFLTNITDPRCVRGNIHHLVLILIMIWMWVIFLFALIPFTIGVCYGSPVVTDCKKEGER